MATGNKKEIKWRVKQYSRTTKAWFSPSRRYKIMVQKTTKIGKNGRTLWEVSENRRTVVGENIYKYFTVKSSYYPRNIAYHMANAWIKRLNKDYAQLTQ